MWPWILITSALGAGLDADGVGLPVLDGSVGRPALLAAPPRLEAGGIALGLRTALELAPLVRTGPESPDPVALIGSVGAARLQAALGLTGAVSASFDLPTRVFASSDLDAGGPAVGDAMAGLWLRGQLSTLRLAGGLAIRLPTGSKRRYSTAGRAIPSLRLSADTGQRWRASTQLGFTLEGATDPARAIGGPTLEGGLAIDRVAERASAGLALRAETSLDSTIRQRRGSPLELGAHGAWLATESLTLDLMTSGGLLPAAGVPTWRLSFSATSLIGKRPEIPIPERGHHVLVLDPDGLPVAGANATFPNGEVLVADSDGALHWEGDQRPTLSAPGLRSEQAPKRGEITLDWAPIELRVRVTTETGEPIDPQLSFTDGGPSLQLTEGLWTTQLLPGTVELRIAASGYGEQAREIIVPPRRFEPITIEAILLPERGDATMGVAISDPQGRGILGSEVRIDGVAVGTSAQGAVEIGGLESKVHEVAVDSRYFQSETTEVDLGTGEETAELSLYYAPGTVRVTATGPNGPIRDGTVYFQGPRALPPLQLGDHGERLVQLSNGEWSCVLSSPAFGLQERTLQVEPDGPVPLNAAFHLNPDVKGTADLLIQLTDPGGSPLEDVEVSLNGLSVGRSGTGGMLRLDGLQAGPTTVQTSGEALLDETTTVVLRDGLQSIGVGLTWAQGAVRVTARSPAGPADAYVEFDGPKPYAGSRLGDPGRKLFPGVPPGEWEVVASHEDGIEVAWTLVSDQAGQLTDVAIQIGEEAGEASLDLSLIDPGGAPIDGAVVRLDGARLAQTASGGRTRISGLNHGRRNLSVTHPLFETWTRSIVLRDGALSELAPKLQWKPGLLDLSVTLGGSPATDAVVYLSGPRTLDPVEPGPDGRALIPAGSGEWDVLVSSPSGGLAERSISLSNGPPTPLEIELDALGALVVRVVDTRGEPVPDVVVHADGVEVGTTDSSGVAVVDRPAPGGSISVEHPHLEPADAAHPPAEVNEQMFEVEWKKVDVPIRVRHASKGVAARISANGPGRTDPITIDGSGVISLTPGRWEILASADDLAVERKTVEVIAGLDQPAPIEFDLSEARIRITAEGIELLDVRFDLDRDTALDQYATVLEEVAATIVADPNFLQVEVQGHSDSSGDTEYNYDLSRRRAQSVVDALTTLGVPPDLIIARGYGPSRPIADNASEQGRAENRRVDFKTVVAD